MFPPLIFAALLLVSVGAVLLWAQPRRDEDTLATRLQDLYRPESTQAVAVVAVADSMPDAPTVVSRVLRHGVFRGLRVLLAQSQSSLSLSAFLARSLAPGAVLGVAACLFTRLPLAAIAAVYMGGAGMPLLWLRLRRDRRMRAVETALPDAADLMGRALRAGHSVQQALELVATETAGPLAQEFHHLHQEQRFGVPLRDALRALAQRVPSRDLQFLITALLVQKETGGDLIEILEQTSRVIRDRLRVQREVKTYTAQGRLTGWILSALPVVLLGLTAVITPEYGAVLFHDPTGQLLLCAAAGLIVVGSLTIRKVVRVEV